jgi:hypothetical protein
MILEILFIIDMVFWGISGLPSPQLEGFRWTNHWFGFFAVLLLGLYIFAPGLRG